jgi:rubredoxin
MEQQYVCQCVVMCMTKPPKAAWEDLSDNFICPECGCFKDEYVIM